MQISIRAYETFGVCLIIVLKIRNSNKSSAGNQKWHATLERREKLLVIKFISVGTLHMPKSMLRIRLCARVCVSLYMQNCIQHTDTRTHTHIGGRRGGGAVLKWHHFEIKLIQSDTDMDVDGTACVFVGVCSAPTVTHPSNPSNVGCLASDIKFALPSFPRNALKLTNLSCSIKSTRTLCQVFWIFKLQF